MTLEQLRPTVKNRVMDLVEEAGHSIDDWANYAGTNPATNPRYCYEWAYTQEARPVILNAWFEEMFEEDESILLRIDPNADASKRSVTAIWKARAERRDEALRFAAVNLTPVRVIICEGKGQPDEEGLVETAKVTARELDDVAWGIRSYDAASGTCVLERAFVPLVFDQFDTDPSPAGPTERISTSGEVFNRDPAVRRSVLARADGCCELCGERGFEATKGVIFLETHHVVPLSKGGPDAVHNVAALCPNHHREAHHGIRKEDIRNELQRRLARAAESTSADNVV